MDPSQHGAPAGWPQGMSLDDVHGTASMRKNLVGAAFGVPIQHTASAGGSIPTPLSPDPEIFRGPQHRYTVPMSYWAAGEWPSTPPLHHQDDSDHAPLPKTPANYLTPYGTYTPAHDPFPELPNFQSAPPRQHTIQPPRLHPSANLLRSSPQQQTTRPEPTPILPSIQQWPTHDLTIDAATKKKQEAYKRKGEAFRKSAAVRRQTISSHISALQNARTPEPVSTPRRKRKAGILDNLVMATSPLSHRRLHHVYDQQQQESAMDYQPPIQQPSFCGMNQVGSGQYHTPLPPPYYPQYGGVFDARFGLYPPQHPLPPSPPKVIDPETIPQNITNNYDEYRWPVKLYQLRAENGYDFAECFLESCFQRTIYDSDEHKWHAHTTKGFIKDGNRLSILVLHNAANPFEWGMPPVSTTSIGVYGLYAHQHSEIHWTTIAPSIPEWFNLCSDHGYLAVKQKWHPDMKALDKRFHRAYWLAAKMWPLGGILNSSLKPEKSYGLLNDDEGDLLAFAEEDLQHEWIGETVSVEESEKIWQKLVDEVDALNLDLLNFEHHAIGGSEREIMVD